MNNNQCDSINESQQSTTPSPENDLSISIELRLRYSFSNLMLVTVNNGVINTQLTTYFKNITTTLTVEVQQIWINWINDVQTNVISSSTLTDDQKIVQISSKLHDLFTNNQNLKSQLMYANLGSWGSVNDLLSVSNDIQSDKTQDAVILDSNNNCELITALQTVTKTNVTMTTVVSTLIVNITTILKTTKITYVQQQANLYNVLKTFIAKYPEFKTTLVNVQIKNYGSFQSFIDVSSKVIITQNILTK